MFNRRSINTVGSGGTCPTQSAGKISVVPLHFFKRPLSGGAHHTVRRLMLKTG